MLLNSTDDCQVLKENSDLHSIQESKQAKETLATTDWLLPRTQTSFAWHHHFPFHNNIKNNKYWERKNLWLNKDKTASLKIYLLKESYVTSFPKILLLYVLSYSYLIAVAIVTLILANYKQPAPQRNILSG